MDGRWLLSKLIRMKITIVSATELEAQPVLDYLEATFERVQLYQYQKGKLQIDLLITGVGSVQATYGLMKYLSSHQTDQLVIIGVGGVLSSETELGTVFLVKDQMLYDLGVREADGQFNDLFDIGLMQADRYPFRSKILRQDGIEELSFLPKIKGITVNTVSGTDETVRTLNADYDQLMESMEGAAYAYVALSEQIPYLEIRSASNYIEVRDRNKWALEKAIERLGEVIQSMIANWSSLADGTPSPKE